MHVISRRLFAVVVVTGTVGCLGRENGGGFQQDDDADDDETEDGSGDTESLPETVEHLRDHFDERGLDVLDTSIDGDWAVFEIQTAGDIDDDIQTAAGAFATYAVEVEYDLLVRVEDRGMFQERFEIKRAWAQEFIEERIDDDTYLERIEATRADR